MTQLSRRIDAIAKSLAPPRPGTIYLCTYADRPHRPGVSEDQARASYEASHGKIPAGARVFFFHTNLGPPTYEGIA